MSASVTCWMLRTHYSHCSSTAMTQTRAGTPDWPCEYKAYKYLLRDLLERVGWFQKFNKADILTSFVFFRPTPSTGRKKKKKKKEVRQLTRWFPLVLSFQCLSKCSIFAFVQIQQNLTSLLLNLNSAYLWDLVLDFLSVFWVSLRGCFRNTLANVQPSLYSALWFIAGCCHLKRKGL